ncbi:hypothetical protein M6B38_402680 [Iris pallida]|uniref:Uncharacterized protein n=1 Tax=Iris pallida TaxID=29817 RepID=A0AAX6FTQ7_IRIPA|nr:hypothetical protein M6B38_402680 [Iris pallida]
MTLGWAQLPGDQRIILLRGGAPFLLRRRRGSVATTFSADGRPDLRWRSPPPSNRVGSSTTSPAVHQRTSDSVVQFDSLIVDRRVLPRSIIQLPVSLDLGLCCSKN